MASTDRQLGELEKLLDHSFQDISVLEKALSHRSATHGRDIGYERLEFLGDRVLGLCIVDMLLKAFPQEPEGALSRRLNELVRQETLAKIAEEVGLAPFISLGRAEEEGGARENPAILSDVCEAVIAALYLDAGMERAREFVELHWTPRLEGAVKPPKDPKSALQEWAMARKLPLPAYEEVARSGPDHAPVFTIRVTIRNQPPAEAQGDSKRAAERMAAQLLLDQVKNNG